MEGSFDIAIVGAGMAGASLAATLWSHAEQFISLWCFLAAALSSLILLHFRRQRRLLVVAVSR